MATVQENIGLAKEVFKKCVEILERKAQDYSNASDPNKNLIACERLGYCAAEVGILIRIQDKLARVHNLMIKSDKERLVQDETIRDTIEDTCNYLVLLLSVIEEKKKKGSIS